jgi:hypothetical protein
MLEDARGCSRMLEDARGCSRMLDAAAKLLGYFVCTAHWNHAHAALDEDIMCVR